MPETPTPKPMPQYRRKKAFERWTPQYNKKTKEIGSEISILLSGPGWPTIAPLLYKYRYGS